MPEASALPRSWKEQFALAAAMRVEDIRHREKITRADVLARERIDEVRIRQAKKEKDAAALEAILAPPQKIAVFRTRLDTYDAKKVEALMENREALDAVRERIDGMLGKAHVLPDGRRVFKTEDGRKVFDEHGQELASEVVEPWSIDDKRPRWETLRDSRIEADHLTMERIKLHDYQSRLDATRERLDKNDLTERDLDRLKTELAEAMPERVRRKLDPDDPAAPGRRADSGAMPDQDMETALRRTLPAPMASGPM